MKSLQSLERAKGKEDEANEEVRRKEKQRLVDLSACFECKKAADSLRTCSCFQRHGVSGYGVQVCYHCCDDNKSFDECFKLLCDNGCDFYKCDRKNCRATGCTPCIEEKETL